MLLALILSLLMAFVYHAAFGRTGRGLVVSILAALTGMVLGEALARMLGQHWLMVGQAHVLHGSVGAWLCMALAARRVA
jgi:uncharacterized membrane protein YeaQ/YmgE (transglycosylase-associated protein family)